MIKHPYILGIALSAFLFFVISPSRASALVSCPPDRGGQMCPIEGGVQLQFCGQGVGTSACKRPVEIQQIEGTCSSQGGSMFPKVFSGCDACTCVCPSGTIECSGQCQRSQAGASCTIGGEEGTWNACGTVCTPNAPTPVIFTPSAAQSTRSARPAVFVDKTVSGDILSATKNGGPIFNVNESGLQLGWRGDATNLGINLDSSGSPNLLFGIAKNVANAAASLLKLQTVPVSGGTASDRFRVDLSGNVTASGNLLLGGATTLPSGAGMGNLRADNGVYTNRIFTPNLSPGQELTIGVSGTTVRVNTTLDAGIVQTGSLAVRRGGNVDFTGNTLQNVGGLGAVSSSGLNFTGGQFTFRPSLSNFGAVIQNASNPNKYANIWHDGSRIIINDSTSGSTGAVQIAGGGLTASTLNAATITLGGDTRGSWPSSPWNISGNNLWYTAGNVGIGVSSPASGAKLHISGGKAYLDGLGPGSGLALQNHQIYQNASNNALYVSSAGGQPIVLNPNGGNVGIGTTPDASARLHVAGGIYSNAWCAAGYDVCANSVSDNWLYVFNKAGSVYKGLAASSLYVADSDTYISGAGPHGELHIGDADGVAVEGRLSVSGKPVLASRRVVRTQCDNTYYCYANCNSGEVVIGGGCGSGDSQVITSSQPIISGSVDQWHCSTKLTSSRIFASAICTTLAE